MKYLSFLLFSIILTSCATDQSIIKQENNLKKIVIKTPNDKYNSLLRYELKKLTKSLSTKKIKYQLNADVNFSSEKVMSIRGKHGLKEMTIKANYSLTGLDSTKQLFDGNVLQKTNYGSVSSLYSNNSNESFIKERYTKKISKIIFNKIKLILNKIEN